MYALIVLIASLFSNVGLSGGIDCLYAPDWTKWECAVEFADNVPIIGESLQDGLLASGGLFILTIRRGRHGSKDLQYSHYSGDWLYDLLVQDFAQWQLPVKSRAQFVEHCKQAHKTGRAYISPYIELTYSGD